MDMNLIRAMPIPQRIELVQEILDSIAVDTRKPTLGDELMAELDRRLEADEANPEAGVPWEQVEAAAAHLQIQLAANREHRVADRLGLKAS